MRDQLTAVIALSLEVDAAIRAHGASTFPHECCGALLGRESVAQEAFALPNTTEEGPRRRFLVRPDDYRVAEKRAREQGLDLLGFYHSHPDHPAVPSQYRFGSRVAVVLVRHRLGDGRAAWRSAILAPPRRSLGI